MLFQVTYDLWWKRRKVATSGPAQTVTKTTFHGWRIRVRIVSRGQTPRIGRKTAPAPSSTARSLGPLVGDHVRFPWAMKPTAAQGPALCPESVPPSVPPTRLGSGP
ncbi:hypothetical protein GCM10023191_013600 [Actinoallomurus oryzae]|uniref:Uncharacterized protein n=1 Tax=Actinoallomurus oryzae TaxID=502180 RepID=A0ABP8PF07_9ACTN